MTDRARTQRLALVTARLKQGGMPSGEVERPQLLERMAPEVRHDLVAGKVAVALPGGAGEVRSAVQPLLDVLADRHRRWIGGGTVDLFRHKAGELARASLRVPWKVTKRVLRSPVSGSRPPSYFSRKVRGPRAMTLPVVALAIAQPSQNSIRRSICSCGTRARIAARTSRSESPPPVPCCNRSLISADSERRACRAAA